MRDPSRLQRAADRLAAASRRSVAGRERGASVFASQSEVDQLARAFEQGAYDAEPIGREGDLYFVVGVSVVGGDDVLAAE